MISDLTNIGIPKIADKTAEIPVLSSEYLDLIESLEENCALFFNFRSSDIESYLLDKDLTKIGRDVDSDILLKDYSVSRKHVEVNRRDGKFYLKDCDSLNGTYINKKIQNEEYQLKSGDEVQIGKFRLLFYMNDLSKTSNKD